MLSSVEFSTLGFETYQDLIETGEIDTVMCATPDPYGRLVGKRLTIQAFQALCIDGNGVHATSHMFATDIELNSLELPVSSAANGWADIRLVPDLTSIRRIPWEKNTLLALCDAYEADSDDLLAVAPRSILKAQVERARQAGIGLKFASELEFYLSRTPHDEAWKSGYRDLDMLSSYRSDYQMLQSSRDEWFIHQIRTMMPEFGVSVESSKPEWGLGQHEITLDYCDALEMADRHVLFKHGIKELAYKANLTPTFMAKPSINDIGSSCHLHVSIWDEKTGSPLCWGGNGMSTTFGSFVAGQMKHAVELGLLFAPTVNSYKRFLPNQFAGAAIALGHDNRSCAFRLVGTEDSFRVENRIPGADVNPYYAYSATIMAGLEGIEQNLPAPAIFSGNAWDGPEMEFMTTSLHSSIDRFAQSSLARSAFGEEVYEHILASSQSELLAFDSGVVTDWETKRYYERV